MKLSLITENISRNEFFDFYSLLYTSKEPGHQNQDEILKHLTVLCDIILQDHLNQFSFMLINRLPDTEDEETVLLLQQYGITQNEDYMLFGVENLDLKQRAQLIEAIIKLERKHGFTGVTWLELGKTFLQLAKTPPNLNSKILAIDKIYNLLHHGGMIADYMDENRWLEDALNIRDNANPAQLFALASPNVRALIGRTTYANLPKSPVTELNKLYTALRRAAKDQNGITITKNESSLNVIVNFQPLIYSANGRSTPWNIIGNNIPDHTARLINSGYVKLSGESLVGEIDIAEYKQYLQIMTPDDSYDIVKPINRQHQLACDIIQGATEVGKGGQAKFKTHYYSAHDTSH